MPDSYNSTAVDLSRLIAPDVVEQLSYEAILAAKIAAMQALMPTFDATVESDPVVKLLQVFAYQELVLRQNFNDRARSVMLAYATGNDLDHLAALFGVTRMELAAANSAVGAAAQAEAMCHKYNVTKIGIDTTGVGKAVHQLVVKFFPMAEAINYSVQTKTALVFKAKNVITQGRLEFDGGWLDMAQAFMAIRPEITKGGTQVTYVASRAGGVGHADLAWAVMHALFFEPLDIMELGGGSIVEIC